MTTKRRAFGWTGVLLMGLAFACDNRQPLTAVRSGRDLVSAQPAAPTYTAINFPGADRTAVFGVNGAGTIVGDFSFTPGGQIHGFMLTAGAFTELDFPKAFFTRPEGINDGGTIVGLYEGDNSGTKKIHGFLLTGRGFSSIDFPGANETTALGIDKQGDIVGGYCTGSDSCYATGTNLHGYLLAGGAFTTIDFPGAVFTELSAIAGGVILGRYAKSDATFHLFELSNGRFTSIDFPGAVETAPFISRAKAGGINGDGDIASYYCTSTVCTLTSTTIHGFVVSGGVPTSFDFPAAIFTVGLDVNSSGDVVGTYIAPDGRDHGFLRTP